MKTSELMLGDWVNTRYGHMKVSAIYGKTIEAYDEGVVHHEFEEEQEIDWFDDIAITPEILEKNGFERSGTEHFNLQCWACKVGKRFVCIYQSLCDNSWCCKDVWIRSVREFQHLLRLFKFEKEIIL